MGAQIRIYNTLTRRKERFEPLVPGRVRMYFCGPTVYAETHIGHLRPALTGDMIARYLRYLDYDVYYVVNFTDIDDKIIQRARETGRPAGEISQVYMDDYTRVMKALGIDQVDRYVQVTRHMPEIIASIQSLMDKGYAYEVDGDVFYEVARKPDYGKLSGRRPEELLAGARVEVDPRKKAPLDFALWKSAKEGEPAWESPWGPGRPGWHIECSVMSAHYLGETFDIHGGGDDLIFPHHENELAQAEACTGQPFARYWVHNGMIQVDGEKMSKSLGNFVTAGELLERYPAPVIRLFMFTTHYRKPLNFSLEALEEARKGWQRLQGAYGELVNLLDTGLEAGADVAGEAVEAGEAGEAGGHPLLAAVSQAKEAFLAAMADDFNSARALAALFDLVRAANTYRTGLAGSVDGGAVAALAAARTAMEELGGILGVIVPAAGTAETDEDGRRLETLVAAVLALREEARRKKEWALADRLRDDLLAAGIQVEDAPGGPKWKRVSPAGERVST